MAKKRAATCGYIRVSTEEQANEEKGHISPEEQEKAIQRTCKARDWPFWKNFYDLGASGDDIRRDGLWQMFRAIKRGEVNRVVVAYRDRLMKDTGYLKLTIQFLAASQVELYAGDSGMMVSEDTGYDSNMAVSILGIVDEYGLETTRRKTRDALALKKAKGMRLGKPPAGFYRTGKMGNFKPRAQTLRMEGLAASHSVEELARMGFKVESGKHKKKGKLLNAEQIRRRLKNMKDWRGGTLDDRLKEETVAMRERYEKAQEAKVERMDEYETKLKKMIPLRARIRGSRL